MQKRIADDPQLQAQALALGQLLLSQPQGYGVAFMDADGVISGWNAAAAWITGWEAAEVIGRSISVIFTPEDCALGLHAHELQAAQRMSSVEDERWHLRKDGSRFWASGLCLPLQSTPGGFVKMFKDATHLRARLQTLENETRQLLRERVEREEVLAIVAHELRNPLAPIAYSTALLARQDNTPMGLRSIEIIERQVEAMKRLIEDLVDRTRLHVGKLHMAQTRVDLLPMIKEACDASAPTAQAKGVELEVILPPASIEVEVDPGRIQQVVANLLSNAIRFSQPGGHVAILVNIDQGDFLIQVRDDGVGIGPDLLPRIFDMFTQAGDAGSQRGEGLGIGLAVVKEVVRLHQGSIEVRSEGLGKGSEFTARMPISQARGLKAEAD